MMRKRNQHESPIAKQLADLIEKSQLTQRAFAARVDITPEYLCDLKQGRAVPTLGLLARIGKEFGVTFEI